MTSKQTPETGKALRRGTAGRCPDCGTGRLFDSYLALHESCAHCGLDLRPYTPAAGPAFLTVAVLGVLTGPLLWAAAAIFSPDRLVLALVGIIALPILAVLLLRVTKGAMVGYLWSLGKGNHDIDGQG